MGTFGSFNEIVKTLHVTWFGIHQLKSIIQVLYDYHNSLQINIFTIHKHRLVAGDESAIRYLCSVRNPGQFLPPLHVCYNIPRCMEKRLRSAVRSSRPHTITHRFFICSQVRTEGRKQSQCNSHPRMLFCLEGYIRLVLMSMWTCTYVQTHLFCLLSCAIIL